ncbi:hypothetical protein FACS1894198_1120 [Clostridia bacterium]|nr:hypothetical protein FACS1894198_1120 [Clostridia bacterium]
MGSLLVMHQLANLDMFARFVLKCESRMLEGSAKGSKPYLLQRDDKIGGRVNVCSNKNGGQTI